ncbi:hypothetical protein [Flavobacterium sp.]|uniref:hypothetical protein n=1 Tax=Flavobacterium sp. TaxID=239 RepID=UPI00375271D4
MKNFSKYCILSLMALLISCKEEVEKPKVIYGKSEKPKTQISSDTSKIVVADLPIQMVGTSVLIHPIGALSVSENRGSKIESTSYDRDQSFVISNSNEYEITGYLSNLKFQQVGSDSLKVLTDKPVMIERITYLKNFSDKTKKQLLVYVLEDMDSNGDGKLDGSDIKNLYVSEINGAKFIKLSVDLQELIDWNIIESQNRIYFRTIEDINKNGAFDKDDKVHYQYVHLLDKELKAIEYNPI